MTFTAPDEELTKPPETGGFSAPPDEVTPAPAGFTAPKQDIDAQVHNLSQQDHSAIYAHAAEHPEDFETAFQADKLRRSRGLAAKAGEFITSTPAALWHGIQGLGRFAAGAVETPLHAIEWWKEPETKLAENTLAAQHGELSLKSIAHAIPGSTESTATTTGTEGEPVQGKIKLPKGDAAKVEALRKQQGGGQERALFAQRVQQTKNEAQLARGEPLDTGAIAGIYGARNALGQAIYGKDFPTETPSQEIGPEALRHMGVAQADPGTVGRESAASDPTMLALAAAPGLPGAGVIGGGATELAGKVAGGIGKGVSATAFSAIHPIRALRTILHPASIATDAMHTVGGRGLQAIGDILEQQGKEMRTGVPSPMTTAAATAAATGESALGINAKRALGDAAAKGVTTAVGMAPLNIAQSEGDPKALAESTIGAGVFGGALGAFQRNRPMMVEAVRPFLRSEGARALAEAGEGNDPLASKSAAYIMSMPPAARDSTLEAIGALQGLPAATKNGQPQRAKLYVLNEADYQKAIEDNFGREQAASGGGRGFFLTNDGKAFVNGEYNLKLGPDELSHTIGHEFGGHAAANVMRAAAVKGGALYQGLMDAAKQALFVRQPSGQHPSGTPSPDFKRFVDAYNLRFDPTGRTQRLDWRNPEAIEEFIAEQSGQLMAAKGAGELALPQTVQDRLNDSIGRFLGSLVGVDTRKVGTETHFSREEIGQLSQMVQDSLAQVVGMKLRGGAEIPETSKTTDTRIAELNQIIAKPRPATGAPLETMRAWIAEQKAARRELADMQQPSTGTPATGPAPVAPSAPAIVSPPEVTTDALKALSVMGIKGPKASALMRTANAQHGSPINDAGQLAAGAFRIHGGGTVKPGEFVPKPQAPAQPVPIPTGDKGTFRDELGATHVVTGPAPGAPRIGDIVATRDGEIRRITRIAGDTVDTARPIDPLNTRGPKTHKLADIQPLAHDYAEPTPATPGSPPEPANPALSVQPKGGGFIIIDAAGNQVGKTNFPTQAGAEQSIRQRGKGRFSLPAQIIDEQGNEVFDILDAIVENGGGGIHFGNLSPEEQEKSLPRHIRNLLASDDSRNDPDAVASAIANGDPERGIQGFGDGTPETMYSEITKAIEARRSSKLQQEAEAKRLKAEEKAGKKGNAPAPEPTLPDNLPPEPAVATAVSEGPTGAEEPAPLSPADVDQIAAQAEQAVTAARAGTRKKAHTAAKEITDAQVDAVAEAHEQSVPANYQGVKLRSDATGKRTISGTFNPSRPFDAFLLKLADLSKKHVGILQDLQSKIGQTVTVNYGHAPTEEGEVTSGARKAAQAASSAQDRASGEAPQQNEDKNFIPLEVRFNKGKDTPSITILGASPEKLLNNFNLAGKAVTELGGEVPYRDIHDPHLVADMKQLAQNHVHGYRYDGKPIESFPDQPVAQTQGFKPNVIPVERFEFLNLMLGDESAKTGKKGTSPDQKVKQGLAANNQIPMTEAGETNMLREMINRHMGAVGDTTWSKATIENPLSEALRVDLINEVKPEVSNEDASIRPHGYAGDISRFFGEGSPNRTFTAAGFLPDTGAPKTAQERARERIAEREKLPDTAKPIPQEAAKQRIAAGGKFMPDDQIRKASLDAWKEENGDEPITEARAWWVDRHGNLIPIRSEHNEINEYLSASQQSKDPVGDAIKRGMVRATTDMGLGGNSPDVHYEGDVNPSQRRTLRELAEDRGGKLINPGGRDNLYFMPDDSTKPEEEGAPSGPGPSGSQPGPLSPDSSSTSVTPDQRKENLMAEAEAAGLTPSLELMKAVIRGDRDAMDKLRRQILERTGRPAKWMPDAAAAPTDPVNNGLSDMMKRWDADGIDSYISAKNGDITLHQIIVPKDRRGQGVGTEKMNELISFAQKNGQRVLLTPGDDFGATSKARLERFYRSLGFVPNSGRNKDFRTRETMIWRPIEGAQFMPSPSTRPSAKEAARARIQSRSPISFMPGTEDKINAAEKINALGERKAGQP